MTLDYSWLLFYGMHEFHLSRQEIDHMRYGEMLDLISCLAVYGGSANLKKKYSYEDSILLLKKGGR